MFYSHSLESLSPHDAYLFNIYGRGPASSIPFSTFQSAFLHHARHHPNLIAVEDFSVFPPRRLRYAEVARYAVSLAHELRRRGVQPGSKVPVVARRGVEMVIGILAVLIVGAQYIPLDERVSSKEDLCDIIHSCCQSQLLLCLRATKARLEGLGLSNPIHVLEDSPAPTAAQADNMKRYDIREGNEDDSCFTIYTSDVTSIPTGVEFSHRNLMNLVSSESGKLGLRPGVKIGAMASVESCISQLETLCCLANGSTLVLRGLEWETVLREIDVLFCTPSTLAKFDPIDFPNIQCVATVGDSVTPRIADMWAANKDLYSYYGPAELSYSVTIHKHVFGEPIPLGVTMSNNNVYVLDNGMMPVPVGEVGILWGGGRCVTKGYASDPEETARRYHPDKFLNDGTLMYNTGELARWNSQGALEKVEQVDDEVRTKAHRLHPDAVRSNLLSCTGVQAAFVLEKDGDIIAFVYPQTCDIDTIRSQMAILQPYHALPTRIILVDNFPLTLGGEVDQGALQLSTSTHMLQPARLKIQHPKRAVVIEKMSEQTLHEATSIELSSMERAILAMPRDAIDSSRTSLSSPTMTGTSDGQRTPKTADFDEDLPAKNQGKRLRGLRHTVLIVYRRIFSFVWILNFAFFAVTFYENIDRVWWSYAAFINLTLAILIRQDHVINLLFTVFSSVPRSWPLWIRKLAAKIFHLGGVHSGAASAAVLWFLGATIDSICNKTISVETEVISLVILVILFSMIIMAYPSVRKTYHNRFEMTHRFAGWFSLVLIWVQAVLSANDTRGEAPLHRAILVSPNIWMLVAITLSIASSWALLCKYTVQSEVLSNHALRIHFDYMTPVHGSAIRLSERPLLEWHAFATIPELEVTRQRPKGFSVVVSRAGDWTGRQIDNPPTKMWVRGVPAFGVMRVNSLFRRLVMVATGSGIGPCLGYIQNPHKGVQFRVIWSTPEPEKRYGQKLCDAVRAGDPNAIIWDTRTKGRPAMVKLCYNVAKSFDAEAVIIIANETITQQVVYGLETRGVPAYGAIWDS